MGLRGEEEKLSLEKQGRGAESEAARRGGGELKHEGLLFFGRFCHCREVFVPQQERGRSPKRERKRKGAEK